MLTQSQHRGRRRKVAGGGSVATHQYPPQSGHSVPFGPLLELGCQRHLALKQLGLRSQCPCIVAS